jgi:HSP20 family protein
MSPFNELRREMDQLFDSFRGEFDGYRPSRQRICPALNIWEDAECLYAEAEVPGMKLDDLEIYVVGNELTIKGRRRRHRLREGRKRRDNHGSRGCPRAAGSDRHGVGQPR